MSTGRAREAGREGAPEEEPASHQGKRGVVLDRDGTLIDFVRDPDLGAVVPAFHPVQIRFLPGVIEGLRLLSDRGFVLAIATNQPGPAKGQVAREAIERTNDALLDRLRGEGIAIAKLAVCWHHPEGGPGGDATLVRACDCRKPKPGMILRLLADLDLDPSRTFMVGDAMTDVEAGAAAGTHTALLAEPGRCEMCPMKEGAPLLRSAPQDRAREEARPEIIAPRFDQIAHAIVARLA